MRRKYLIVFVSLISLVGLFSCRSKSPDKKRKTLEYKVLQNTGDVILGDDAAPDTIFLYASYHCKFCRYFFSRTYPGLKENFLDNGKIKLVVKWLDFNDNPQVLYALQAAGCISRFGVYEKFHQLLLVNPDVVFTNDFAKLVDDIMDDNPEIAQCILQNADYAYLRKNVKEFRKNGLTGTPTFVINNSAYSGFISYDNFEKLIKQVFNMQP